MTCLVCGIANDVKTWAYGTTCDAHDDVVRAAYHRWRQDNPMEYVCMFSLSDTLSALLATLKQPTT